MKVATAQLRHWLHFSLTLCLSFRPSVCLSSVRLSVWCLATLSAEDHKDARTVLARQHRTLARDWHDAVRSRITNDRVTHSVWTLGPPSATARRRLAETSGSDVDQKLAKIITSNKKALENVKKISTILTVQYYNSCCCNARRTYSINWVFSTSLVIPCTLTYGQYRTR